MITLNDDCLIFSFPEVADQIRVLVEGRVKSTLPKLNLPPNREELVDTLFDYADSPGSEWYLKSHRVSDFDSCLAAAAALTHADVESALREVVREKTGVADSIADLTVRFQRTLRIPDDEKTYPLPAGLGSFPLRSVDDYAETAPDEWRKRGGVVMPMYQSEALWIGFSSRYRFAVKIATGKINSVSGEPWTDDLQCDPQNYVVAPKQPWLDGFSVGEGIVRQFVAMPLGTGYSVEEQLTGKADIGGLQLQVYPMHAEAYSQECIAHLLPSTLHELLPQLFASYVITAHRHPAPRMPMGLGAGGMMRQEIYKDPYNFAVWNRSQTKRCFVHLCNSMDWREITGTNPPHPPLTAEEYKRARIPWFDYYRDDQKPLKGSKRLAGVKSVAQLGKAQNSQPISEDTPITPNLIIQYGNTRRPGEIREFQDKQ